MVTLFWNYKRFSTQMQTENQRYFCYSCERHFEHPQFTSACCHCQSDAIEIAPASSDPSQFEVYSIQQPANISPNSQPSNNNAPNRQQSSHPFNPFGPLMGNLPFFQMSTNFVSHPGAQPVFRMNMNMGNQGNQGNGTFDSTALQLNELNHILSTGGLQQYINNMMGEPHLTPAVSQEVSRLDKVEIVKECPICLELNLEGKKGYKLKCSHEFHVECLTPWFQRMNTCPACRQRI